MTLVPEDIKAILKTLLWVVVDPDTNETQIEGFDEASLEIMELIRKKNNERKHGR